MQVVDTKCFTVTESRREECEGIEGENENGFEESKTDPQNRTAEHECKISHAHNKMCTTLHSFNPVPFPCPQTPYPSTHHYKLFLAF